MKNTVTVSNNYVPETVKYKKNIVRNTVAILGSGIIYVDIRYVSEAASKSPI